MEQYIPKSALVAEIENLENSYKKCPTRNSYEEGLKDGRLIGYKDALHKINTLEMKEVSLQEEPDLNWKEMSLQEKKDLIASLQKDVEEPVGKDLEKAAATYTQDWFCQCPEECENAFKAGAQWQKEKMMAKAIDAKLYSNGMFVPLIGIKDKEKVSNIKFGDKVKVIILKED